MKAQRKHPLVAGGWARTMETPPRVGKLVNMWWGPLGTEYWTIRFLGEGKPILMLAGYLEAVPSEFAP